MNNNTKHEFLEQTDIFGLREIKDNKYVSQIFFLLTTVNLGKKYNNSLSFEEKNEKVIIISNKISFCKLSQSMTKTKESIFNLFIFFFLLLPQTKIFRNKFFKIKPEL